MQEELLVRFQKILTLYPDFWSKLRCKRRSCYRFCSHNIDSFWAENWNKTKLTAKQISKRGGVLECELKNDRILIGGKCKTYLKGEIFIK